jgi:hypothetical protein
MSNTISKTLRKSTNETCIQDDQSNIVFELLSDSELHDLITDLNDDGIDEILLAPNVKRQTENKEDLQLCQSNKSTSITCLGFETIFTFMSRDSHYMT